MSGLIRNIIAILRGLLRYGSEPAAATVVTAFRAWPPDCGTRVLKSDRYLQMAETAQLDYLLRTGRLFDVMRQRASFVNLAQQVKFSRPVPMFSSVRVETRIIHANEKTAFFSHAFHVGDSRAAEVLVKMKFKRGGLTVPPSTFLPVIFNEIPEQVVRWEAALETL